MILHCVGGKVYLFLFFVREKQIKKEQEMKERREKKEREELEKKERKERREAEKQKKEEERKKKEEERKKKLEEKRQLEEHKEQLKEEKLHRENQAKSKFRKYFGKAEKMAVKKVAVCLVCTYFCIHCFHLKSRMMYPTKQF